MRMGIRRRSQTLKPFSQAKSVTAYAPQVKSSLYSFPLLAYDTKSFNNSDLLEQHLDNFEFYDMSIDASKLLRKTRKRRNIRNAFSIIHYWEPEDEAQKNKYDVPS